MPILNRIGIFAQKESIFASTDWVIIKVIVNYYINHIIILNVLKTIIV